MATHADKPRASALHAVVRGRVQGVGFRMFVQRRAETAGLSGWVRNLPDGSVELYAEGPRSALEALLAHLRQGPRLAMVETVEHEWVTASGLAGGFAVRG